MSIHYLGYHDEVQITARERAAQIVQGVLAQGYILEEQLIGEDDDGTLTAAEFEEVKRHTYKYLERCEKILKSALDNAELKNTPAPEYTEAVNKLLEENNNA